MNERAIIDKTLVQSHRQCRRRAWLESRGAVMPQRSRTAQAMLKQGEVVHDTARRLFPGAVRIGAMPLKDAAEKTAAAIAGGATCILEAGFVSGNLGVRADAIERCADGWKITEFKSGSECKDEYLDDTAIQFACATAAGLKVELAAICHPDTSLVMPEEGRGEAVLVREDVTEIVRARAGQALIWLRECEDSVGAAEEPDVRPGKHCKDPYECPFSHHCGTYEETKVPDDVQHLPSHAGLVGELIRSGVTRISELPDAAFTHERNLLLRDAIRCNGPVVRKAFAEQVMGIPFPRAVVDFEAAAFAIPRFAGMRAHQAVPFQWSLHRVPSRGAEPQHSEFINVTGEDPRRTFAESLVECATGAESVIVYSSYEKSRLKELAEVFPDLAEPLAEIIGKLVDLLPMARRGYYHPQMVGSWSIKKILPTLPQRAGMSYGELQGVADGMEAQAAYIELTDPCVVGVQKEALKDSLLTYCELDTGGLLYFMEYIESHA